MEQAGRLGNKIDYVVHASGSGTTQAGLILGTKLVGGGVSIVGISDGNPRRQLSRNISELYEPSSKMLKMDKQLRPKDVIIFDEFTDEYGVLGKNTLGAMKLLGKTEGIFLDPMYTAKAMYGLVQLVRRGYLEKDDTVVFLHTGGTPMIFPFASTISGRLRPSRL
jgi:1-aminocyclopropane-1-carboxylate deaminase/D-cysteine desulfhydrase-like pyridoxal-dependent ACC family enzyme